MEAIALAEEASHRVDQEDLWRDSFQTSLLVTAALAFAWLFWLVVAVDKVELTATFAAVGLVVSCIVGYSILVKSLQLAALIFPCLSIIVLSFHIWLNSAPVASFLVACVILAASLGLSSTRLLVITLGACAGLGLAAMLTSGDTASIYLMAMLMSALAMLARWLAVRNLSTVLGWATRDYQYARESMAALRERQSELGRLSDALLRSQERLHYLNLRLDQAKLVAEESYRLKQRFAAYVSHELRMPLNLIIGFSEMMAFSAESYDGVRMPSEYREDVLEIYNSSRHLLDLVEDVLAMAQIEAGRLSIQPEQVDLGEVVRDAAETVRPLVEGKGLSLKLSLEPHLPTAYIDSVRIRQVLLNLLNNACRFTERGYIELSMHGGGMAIIEVRDTGRGIAPEDIPHLFEDFSTPKSLSPEYSGFGLGLALSKQLIDAHGGSITVSSHLGEGSCFTISLPYAIEDTRTKGSVLLHTPTTSTDRSKPVLLCISERGMPMALNRYLSNYHIVHATPQEATDAYQSYVPVSLWINEDPGSCSVPAWLLPLLRSSPSPTVVRCRVPTDEDVSHRLGVDAVIRKPVTRRRVEEGLARLAPEQGPCRVLVVDDDPHTVRMVKRMLASMRGYEVAEACGGQEALDYLSTNTPDVVLLDLAMPHVSGYDVLRAIRSRDGSETRVVLMTAFSIEEEQLPVYRLSLENREGFAVPRCLDLINRGLAHLTEGPR